VVTLDGEVKNGTLDFSITVSDTGCGIPQDRIGEIFERFSQVETEGQPRLGGTGLGLSIVAKIVQLMGGKHYVTSHLGEGTCIRIDLPLACHDVRPPAVFMPEGKGASRIIVVDASLAHRESITKPLAYWGFDVCGVEDVSLALALAHTLCERGTPPDLVMFGCNGAGRTCFDMANAFEAGWALAPLPKVLMTPYDTPHRPHVPETLNIKAVTSAPMRQAELYHTVLCALQAQKQAQPYAAPAMIGEKNSPSSAAQPSPAAAIGGSVLKGSTVSGPQAAPMILVAEDNPVNQLVMAQILDLGHFSYQIVADGALAVDAFRQNKPALVLMDVNMPRLNGFQATAAIRNMRDLGGDTVPIIGVTALASDAERDACLRCGMSDHLAKPISPDALLARIAHWLPVETRGASRN
jgi:CheY-like chemotaxis protein